MSEILDELFETINARRFDAPPDSYTAKLFRAGNTEIAKKVGEEAIEVIVSALGEGDARFISESADLVYHLMVLLAVRGVAWGEVVAELTRRRGSVIPKA